MKSISVLIVTVVVLSLCGTVYADRTVWYVHPDSALNTIQAGLDSCANNDIVLVGPGTYVENIVWPNTQGIHLISELGPEVTIIDGDSTGRVITITSVVDSLTVITGFTVQHGRASGPWGPGGGFYCNGSSPTISGNIISDNRTPWQDPGGGIFCEGNSTAIIRNNVIVGNFALMAAGGGIYCLGSSPIITGNTITENNGLGGGGISCDAASPIITNNTITHNWATWFTVGTSGGGILCVNNSVPIIRHNTISMNTATVAWGGGLHCDASSPIIDSCTISDNINGGIGATNGAIPIINHCNITDNTNEAVRNRDSLVMVVAEYNWWGDASGPYHPTVNPSGQGDTVSDYVDFDPWLYNPWGIGEEPIVKPAEARKVFTATIFRGSLQLREGKKCRVFDITGRVVEPNRIQPGIYFIEVDGVVTQKVVKIR